MGDRRDIRRLCFKKIQIKGGNRIYIPEFICGFIAGIIIEVILIIVYALYENWKNKH